jgi:hypothetical protein
MFCCSLTRRRGSRAPIFESSFLIPPLNDGRSRRVDSRKAQGQEGGQESGREEVVEVVVVEVDVVEVVIDRG